LNGTFPERGLLIRHSPDCQRRRSHGLYGLAFLCVMSAVVCALFLHIPNPTVSRGRTAALAAE
jgi:hypothetical protein